MTAEQERFVCSVMTLYDRQTWPHNLVGDLVPALMRNDEAEVARVTGLMLIELKNKGQLALDEQAWSKRWIELFGDLLEEIPCPS